MNCYSYEENEDNRDDDDDVYICIYKVIGKVNSQYSDLKLAVYFTHHLILIVKVK